MKNNTARTILLSCLVVIMMVCSFGGGVVTGHFLPIGNQIALPGTTNGNQGGTPAKLTTLFTPFWQAWDIIHQQYVDQPVDDTKLMEGAISGMMQSLGDPHNIYLNPQAYNDFNAQISGNYAGIGAMVNTTGKLLTVVKPFPNSPAEKAGLQAGDQFIAIDGKDVTGMDPESVRQKVLGPEGTTVKLTVQRPGQSAPFDVQITRAVITMPSVTSKMLDNKIAYIQINSFGENTATDFHKQLADLLAQKPAGLILDLRDNPGGLVTAAVSVASEFISSGVIVSEKSGDGKINNENAIPGGLATDASLTMIVLVNENSASASEIVSGALQDTGRAKLLGVTTYGKGSVQHLVPLTNNEGAADVTIAKWLTPKGRTIDRKGLTPDIVVPMTADDVKAQRDPQLDAAVKQLTNP